MQCDPGEGGLHESNSHHLRGDSPSPAAQERGDLSPQAAIECTHLVAAGLQG